MARTIRELHRSFLPGAGSDTAGNASQRKQEVRGRIVVSSYTKGGEALTPADLGLETVDYLSLEVVDSVKGPNEAPNFATWVEDVNQFYVFDRVNDGTTPNTQVVEIAGASALTIAFNAFGDSLTPELK